MIGRESDPRPRSLILPPPRSTFRMRRIDQMERGRIGSSELVSIHYAVRLKRIQFHIERAKGVEGDQQNSPYLRTHMYNSDKREG